MLLDLRQIIEVPGKSVPFECELDTQGLEFDSVKEYKAPPMAEGRVFNEARGYPDSRNDLCVRQMW